MEKQLSDLAAQSGRGMDELVQDAVAGYVQEVGATRRMLDSRYDELSSGSVKLMDGEEAFARLHENIEARHSNR